MLKYGIAGAALASALLAGSAGAQVNTNCAVYGNQINCNSSGGSGITFSPGYGSEILQQKQFDLGAVLEQSERIKQMRAQTALMEQQREEMVAQQQLLAAQQAQLNAQQAQLDAQRAEAQRKQTEALDPWGTPDTPAGVAH